MSTTGQTRSDRISVRTVVAGAKDQVSCDLGGEAAILNLQNGVYYGLDPLGARIWTLIQEPTIVGSVRDVILQEYDVQAEICERDLIALLENLLAEGLIELRGEQAA